MRAVGLGVSFFLAYCFFFSEPLPAGEGSWPRAGANFESSNGPDGGFARIIFLALPDRFVCVQCAVWNGTRKCKWVIHRMTSSFASSRPPLARGWAVGDAPEAVKGAHKARRNDVVREE